ncbi:hypothetical protein, partial [Duganella sp. SG902]|uniref:hypothetical protein n=1 Tax=Duganella sp. SG902 TaxID=2587016 RepID=UPI001C40179B
CSPTFNFLFHNHAHVMSFQYYHLSRNSLGHYTLGLRAELRLTGPATRPKIFLQVTQHQLYLEQTHGIDAHRAYEYSTLFAQSTFSK